MELIKETVLEAEFEGYDGDMVFTFTSGEKWQQIHYKYRYKYKYRPSVKLWRDGSNYYLEFQDMDEMVQVRRFQD
jgi:hypothetical protein